MAQFKNSPTCPTNPKDYVNVELFLTRGSADKAKMLDAKFVYYEIILALKIKERVVQICDNGNQNSMIPILVTIYPSQSSVPLFGAYLRVLHNPKGGPGWAEINNYVKDGTAP
jgi:hypothetical protein